ncbi:unnamed protein product [Caenorhabditis angaria]|uniref:BTB domain-containing protein n=1 Tax=Caenorhabditis angaria TaxID=860376 RepID=A0A9P1I5Q5_9PELO|nr:unnamed protein product [Caenorhabditis angaria]
MNLPIIKSKNKLKASFDKIREWDGKMRRSEEFDIAGVKWRIGIQLEAKDDNNKLHVFLCCEMNGVWISAVDNLQFKLLRHYNHDTKNFNATQYLMTSENSVGVSISSYYWSTILLSNYGYLSCDTLSFETTFDFIYQHFNNIEHYTDFVININNLFELNVNKGLLCASSEYFYNQIVVERKGEEEIRKITIPDIELGPFMLLLALMHPSLDVPAEKLENSLELANRFKINSINLKYVAKLKAVFEYHENDKEYQMKSEYFLKCLQFAEKYEMNQDFMNFVLKCFKTSNEIKTFSEVSGFETLKESTKVLILQRVLETIV